MNTIVQGKTMVNSKKIIILGCFDLFTSILQAMIISASDVISLQFYFQNKSRECLSWGFLIIHLFATLSVTYSTYRQVLTVRELIRAAEEVPEVEEFDAIQIKWSYWTVTTSVLALIWYFLFGIKRILRLDFPLAYTGVIYLGIIVIRTIIIWEYYKLLAEEVTTSSIRNAQEEQITENVRTKNVKILNTFEIVLHS